MSLSQRMHLRYQRSPEQSNVWRMARTQGQMASLLNFWRVRKDLSLRLCTNCFLTVWATGRVPAEWMEGRSHCVIIQGNGKGLHSACSNYRPISLLSLPGKVFVHVLLARIQPLLNKCRRPQQSGFTTGRSTIDAILAFRLLAELHRAYNCGIYWQQICISFGRQKSTIEGTARLWYSTVSSSPHSGSPYWHHGTGSHTIWPVGHISHNFRSTSSMHTCSSPLLLCHWLVDETL